jgi:hypothetical protein
MLKKSVPPEALSQDSTNLVARLEAAKKAYDAFAKAANVAGDPVQVQSELSLAVREIANYRRHNSLGEKENKAFAAKTVAQYITNTAAQVPPAEKAYTATPGNIDRILEP